MLENGIIIIIKKVDGIVKAHAIRQGNIDREKIASIFPEVDEGKPKLIDGSSEDDADPTEGGDRSPFPESFEQVERAFSRAMLMYRRSVIETIKFAPIFANLVLGFNVEKIAQSRGSKREDLSIDGLDVYSLPDHAFGSIYRHTSRSEALIDGAQHLPKISTIGVISSYDAILSDLLRVIFKHRPEIIFTSDRTVPFADLVELESLEAIRDNIISTEIESVIRQSHHDQFSWMEKKFGMKLREGLDVWPSFIEICERRNLLTHTGGVVSEQYIKNCEQHGKKSKYKVGERLDVDIDYLASAVNTVSEIGLKLIHTMWRKFLPDERGRADSALNEAGMNLIAAREYELAENLLHFGVGQRQHSSDLMKRMMLVNLANAAKLGGSKDRCEEVLLSHDWSATSYQFQICVAAVRNNFPEVKRLLKLGGGAIEITPSDFRDWPVFQDARKDKEVQDVFEEVFGEPLVKGSGKVSVTESMPDDMKYDDPFNADKLNH